MNTADIKASDVMSVYSGKAGSCCCGCSGKHATAYRVSAGDDRGYAVGEEECSDRTVSLILRKLKFALDSGLKHNVCPGHEGGFVSHVSVEVGNRLYVAYMAPGVGHDWEEAEA
jgi:hypothetical protein